MSLAGIIETAIDDLERNDLSGLILSLLNVYMDEGGASAEDEKKFLAVVRYLLGIADWTNRKTVADEVLPMKGLPSDIYLYFACDLFSIAEPFFGPEIDLSESDCIHIAKTATFEHRMALAKREELPPAVVLQLLKSGELDVVRTINENKDAAIFWEYSDEEEPEPILTEEDDDEVFKAGETNPVDFMMRGYAKRRQYADMIETLSKATQLPKSVVKDIFNAAEAEDFSCVCKALGVTDDTYRLVSQFRCRRLGQMDRIGEQAAEDFVELEFEVAEDRLRAFQRQSSWAPVG